ncbi:hypothetical protein PFISCL1PPCAC_25072, partial [Pristionchus fissidentatus]
STSNENDWKLEIAYYQRQNELDFPIFGIGEKTFKAPYSNDGSITITKTADDVLSSIVYSEFSIKSDETIADALRLYLNTDIRLRLMTTDGLMKYIVYTKEHVPLMPECEKMPPPAVMPHPNALKAVVDSRNKNRFSCSSEEIAFNTLFLDEEALDVKSVYCAKKGWRDGDNDDHKLVHAFNKEEVYCSQKQKPVPIFKECDSKKKLCFSFDDSGKLVPITTSTTTETKGLELDLTNDKAWSLVLAYDTKVNKCAFKIASNFEFDCFQQANAEPLIGGASAGKLKASQKEGGKLGHIFYEIYEITPNEAAEPVFDVLKFYENANQKLSVKLDKSDGSGKTFESENIDLSKFVVCDIDGNAAGPSDQAVKAKQSGFVFDCSAEPNNMNTLYFNAVRRGGKKVLCSQRGWRTDDHKYLSDFNKEQPYCFTETDAKPLPMFVECNMNHCHSFDNDDNPTKLEKVDSTMKKKFGIYLE